MLLWSTICFNETVLDTRWLDKSVEQIESDLERGFVKHWLNSVEITGPIYVSTYLGTGGRRKTNVWGSRQ